MNENGPLDGQALGDYREFLVFVARVQLDPRLHKILDPEDIVQKALLQAHEKRCDFRGTHAFQMKAWLRQILLHVLANAVRELNAAKRDKARERSLEAALEESSVRLEAFLAAEQSSPSEQAQRNERALQLEEALAGLPERQRQAVVLKHMHDWSLSAISEHLDTSSSAVAGLLIRGLRQLREALPE